MYLYKLVNNHIPEMNDYAWGIYGDFHKGIIKRFCTCTNKFMHGEFSWEAFIIVGRRN